MDAYAALWSGGKDSCLACYRAIAYGLSVVRLVNFLDESGERSLSHGIEAGILKLQAEAVRLPLAQRPVARGSYEKVFKELMIGLKGEGITGLVSGDIDFGPHREWIERVCGDVGLEPRLPLWGIEPGALMELFVGSGFKAMVVAVKSEAMGKQWLGEILDGEALEKLKELAMQMKLHLCGENGEYHTLVIDGPLFHRTLNVTRGGITRHDGRWLLDIKDYKLG